jgi:hypothetical protein
MGNYHKVDKGDLFIDEGMTLITEVDSDKYLNMSKKRRSVKEKEEIYSIPEDRLEYNYGDNRVIREIEE